MVERQAARNERHSGEEVTNDGEPFKRWTAGRSAALVLDLDKGKTTAAENAGRA